MPEVYYNDSDARACAWLRELQAAGEISEGIVDERSIAEIQAADLAGYTQCHFFAGIGGWPLALRLAGWPAVRPVWTGSCPCQPFSTAGKRKGEADERHLWPAFFSLIRQCLPHYLFGEQVGGRAGYEWLDGVRHDLESEGYAFGAADLPACSVGAPHIRSRLFWVAHLQREGCEGHRAECGLRQDSGEVQARRSGELGSPAAERGGGPGGLALPDGGDSGDGGLQRGGQHGQQPQDGGPPLGVFHPERDGRGAAGGRGAGRLGDSERAAWRSPSGSGLDDLDGQEAGRSQGTGRPELSGEAGGMEHASLDGRQQGAARPPRPQPDAAGAGPGERVADAAHAQRQGREGFWDAYDLVPCRDGKLRRIPRQGQAQPGLLGMADELPSDLVEMWLDCAKGFPLTTKKVPGRVGLLRGYGNAIVPAVAAVFIRAFLEAEHALSSES